MDAKNMSLDDLIKRDKKNKRGGRGGKVMRGGRGGARSGFKRDRPQQQGMVPRFKNRGGAIFKQRRGGFERGNGFSRRP